jgi:hypothetical protein
VAEAVEEAQKAPAIQADLVKANLGVEDHLAEQMAAEDFFQGHKNLLHNMVRDRIFLDWEIYGRELALLE